jgi:transcriptional regulator of met regulon
MGVQISNNILSIHTKPRTQTNIHNINKTPNNRMHSMAFLEFMTKQKQTNLKTPADFIEQQPTMKVTTAKLKPTQTDVIIHSDFCHQQEHKASRINQAVNRLNMYQYKMKQKRKN